jgi:hypothetical protein|tara:strand:+ start:3357 stop:3530 length:174 start_codon:yes stop_codon:yes gene_type:complete
LLKQAGSAIPKAVNDDDMTTEDARWLSDLLEQSAVNLTPARLDDAVIKMASACEMFE